MRWKISALAAAASVLMAGCATTSTTPPPPPPPPPSGQVQLDWQAAIQEPDRDRLMRLDDAWQRALDQAIRDGHESELRALGNLPDPDTALSAA